MKYAPLLFALILASLSQPTVAKPQSSSPTDIGVINKERILYWLDKRGQLNDQSDPQAVFGKIMQSMYRLGS